jgi:glycosyltransferase involved in cell wall biosynthesis
MRVVLVHDWLTGMRGGERVLERWCRMFPDAPLVTLLWNRGSVSPTIESRPIETSLVQHLPGAARHYRWFLPLFPAAIESLRLPAADLVRSSSHCVAKSAIAPAGALHVSYIHTPMRYVWDLEDQYFPPGAFPWPVSGAVRSTCASLRRWDARTADRPHRLIANSAHVADRIRRHWGRAATVIHPPVALERFTVGTRREDWYLLAGAYAPYKRLDLALEACARLGRRVVVAGSGTRRPELERRGGPGAEFVGRVSDEEMASLYGRARALLFPGEEDFGIVPLEAMASGCPVVARGRGGALETVGRGADPASLGLVRAGGSALVPGGVLFGDASVDAMVDALRLLEGAELAPHRLRAHVAPFAEDRFDAAFRAALDEAVAAHRLAASARTL